MCDVLDNSGDSEEYSGEVQHGQEDTQEHAGQVSDMRLSNEVEDTFYHSHDMSFHSLHYIH